VHPAVLDWPPPAAPTRLLAEPAVLR